MNLGYISHRAQVRITMRCTSLVVVLAAVTWMGSLHHLKTGLVVK